MVRFRKRIKKEGVNLLFKETISLGLKTKTIKKNSFKKVIVYLGRVMRDVENKWETLKSEAKTVLQKEYDQLMNIAKVLVEQTRKSKKKIYSVHEPQVDCISKGKVHKKYEFGTKVSVVVPHKEGFVLLNEAFHGNPYDGHTLSKSLEIIDENTKVLPKECYVDKGYKGHKIKNVTVYQSGQKCGVTSWIRQNINRRSMIEGMISHQKRKCHLGKNYLQGIIGDQNNARLSGAGHNLRLISNKLVLA